MIGMLLVVVASLLATGCVGQRGEGKQTPVEIMQTTVTEISPTITGIPITTPANCPARQKNSYVIALGDPFMLSGHSPVSDVTKAKIWIFGKDSVEITNISLREDGSFNYSISGERTRIRNPGTYRIIIQYPRNGSSFSINPRFEEDRQGVFDPGEHLLFSIRSIHEKKVDGLGASETLEREIVKPGIFDTSTNATLVLEEPWIHVNPIGNHTIGDIIVLSGTTNLAAGNEIAYDIKPVDYRLPANARDAVAPTLRVKEGSCGINSWSFGIDSKTFSPKEYHLRMSAALQDASASERFFLSVPEISGIVQSGKKP